MRSTLCVLLLVSITALSACNNQPPAVGNGRGNAVAAEDFSPLVGLPAPDIEQELLDGGRFSLRELQGKKAVILDFWATWCGPCVAEMPLVAKVAQEFRDRDVALICVNQREKPDTIREFLADRNLSLTISLDSTGSAANAYNVEGIPMLVLVDKEGIVRNVHIGFDPAIEQVLRTELNAILAAKNTPRAGSSAPGSKSETTEEGE